MENTQLAVVDSAALEKSKSLSGSYNEQKGDYIPVVKINNTQEKKMVMVDGIETEVTLPIHVGFNISKGDKDAEGRYINEYYTDEFKGVILHERYKIKSKHKVEPNFYSKEFSNFSEPIIIYSGKDEVARGSYKQLKETFQTAEMDSTGKHKKSFDLYLVLYVWVLDSDSIVKFEYKMTGQNKWFDYKASFGQDDHYTAHITEFPLHEEKFGNITFYVADYNVGAPADLQTVIEMQMKLKEALFLKERSRVEEPKEEVIQIENQDTFAYTYKESDNSTIDVSDIPF